MGVSCIRHTSISFSVCCSTPLALSSTMITLSTAVRTRYVSSEKSRWPGVSSRFSSYPRYGNFITEEVTLIPRSFSIVIQSLIANRSAFRALISPAS